MSSYGLQKCFLKRHSNTSYTIIDKQMFLLKTNVRINGIKSIIFTSFFVKQIVVLCLMKTIMRLIDHSFGEYCSKSENDEKISL